ncbi:MULTISPECIES: STELLO glycosyltransferase family protein [Mucilaginibacter]|uniref:STELLO glycosyltransferase family protein n=1 Tax=Mucilaginibacter TaxID=423349 RepID=UPI000E0DA300|nr:MULTISPECIES: STELLO glycosyltransferase family protein [Mucilaginibacter]
MESVNKTKAIVITSIFQPTLAVEAFAKMPDHHLIVVGDKKTPAGWACQGAEYLSVRDQELLDFKLAKALPYNHYCRKMLGYLKAIKNGAGYIIDTDDDNYPNENWCFPKTEGKHSLLNANQGFINIYQWFTDQHVWPRGLPLDLLLKDFELHQNVETQTCKVGIWQGLADEDPDVDAIYRLTLNKLITFNDAKPVVLDKGTIAPFNTQNTLIVKDLFPLLYLPTYVTFRFTDILRGLIAQPIMWLYGYQLGFTGANVVQKRNPHNFVDDLESEMPMYKYCKDIIPTVEAVISSSRSMSQNLQDAYQALHKKGIVTAQELLNLDHWLDDIACLL